MILPRFFECGFRRATFDAPATEVETH